MDFYDVKLWQWMLIGIVGGLLVGVAAVLDPPPRDMVLRTPITAEQFVARLSERTNGRPVVRNLVIHPPRDGRNYVTFDATTPHGTKSFALHTEVPCTIRGARRASIVDHVAAVAAADPQLRFSYPWRESGAYILLTRAGGGLLIAGGWGLLLW